MPEHWGEPERFLKLPEVCRRVGLGKTMIYAMVKDGRFPKPYKLSPFMSRWSKREIVARIADVKDGFEGRQRYVGEGGGASLSIDLDHSRRPDRVA